MAHSYISYRNKNLRVNDFDLIALVFFLKRTARQSDPENLLGDLIGAWINSIQNNGAGNIDLNLDSLLACSTQVSVLLATLHEASEKIIDLPENLKPDFLRQLIELDGIEFGNYKKSFLANVANLFSEMLTNQNGDS